MAEFKDRLEEALSLRSMKPSELAKKTGIGEGAISQYRKGAYKASQRNLEKISKALNFSIPWLMGISDDPNRAMPTNLLPLPEFVRKPRLGEIACGKPILAVEDSGTFDVVPSNVRCDFTLKCKGDSMINARIYNGDIVYIREQSEVEDGEIAAVRIGDEATLKRVYYNGKRIILRACNPLFEDLEYEGEALNDIEILGKAVAFTSKINHRL